MKIGLLHNLYGKYSRGGAETVVAEQAATLKSQGHQVFVISTKLNNEKFEINKNDPKTYYLNSNFYNLAKHNALYRTLWHIADLFSFKKYKQIKKILISEKPDQIITHNVMGLGYLTPLLLRKQKIKHEHFLHDIQLLHPSGLIIFGQENIINSLSAKIYQIITRTLIGSPEQVTSPSNWLLKLHQQHGFFLKSKTVISTWAKKEIKTIEHKNIKKEQLHFLFVGQIESHKGILFLIDVFKKINKPNFILNIVGDGSQLKIAKKIAAKTKIENNININFIGRKSSTEVRNWIKKSDYLIVPSLCYENSPRVIFEAKSLGLPVIASNIGGIPEMLNANDILFAPNDTMGLIKELNKLS